MKHIKRILLLALAFGQIAIADSKEEKRIDPTEAAKNILEAVYWGLQAYHAYRTASILYSYETEFKREFNQHHNTQHTSFDKDFFGQPFPSDQFFSNANQMHSPQVQKKSERLKSTQSDVTFADVVGAAQAKAALQDIVQVLQDPTAYTQVGARMPKGVLLEGPPGNGKTLLAKAVAGEAGVHFISVTGSDFADKYYGEGPRKVKELFESARQHAPCIIFIDEIDGIGKRSSEGTSGDLEQNRIVNAFLTQMDGMATDPKKPIVIIGATNHRQLLDPALLRSGRFDTIVQVENPISADRGSILQLHAKKIKCDATMNFNTLAEQTRGFAGADLENLVNKSAIFAARRKAQSVQQIDFDAALAEIKRGKNLL